jgi:glyoxylase-like metal-dependent hydrolase (beta-lactamase superfamily II)
MRLRRTGVGSATTRGVTEHSHAVPTTIREERQPPREGIEEVAPGILRLQLPISLPGLGHVNCYAMEDSRGITLVDPGLPGPRTWRELNRMMRAGGLAIERVHSVVITHSHPDHFGQAGHFKRKFGADVITHQTFRTFLDPDAEDVEQADDLEHADRPVKAQAESVRGQDLRAGPLSKHTPWGGDPYSLPRSRRVRYWAMRKAAGWFVSTPTPTRRVEDAQMLTLGGREWVAVHTPGHTIDHLCLFDPAAGVMISGDHVLPTITPHISGLGTTLDPLNDFFNSLDRMKTFDGVTTVLPAHGLEFADLGGRADDIKRHHFERLEKLRNAAGEVGKGTVQEYMRLLFAQRSWGSMAESETYAHLEHLRLLGEASVDESGHQLRYSFE